MHTQDATQLGTALRLPVPRAEPPEPPLLAGVPVAKEVPVRVHIAICGRGLLSSVHARHRGSDGPQRRPASMAESEGGLRSAAEDLGPHASHGSPEHPPGKVGGTRWRAVGRS